MGSFVFFKEGKDPPSAASLKKRQRLLLVVGGALGIGLLGWVTSGVPAPQGALKPAPTKLLTAADMVSPQDVWVDRIWAQNEKVLSQMAGVKQQNEDLSSYNKLLEKRLDVMESLFKGSAALSTAAASSGSSGSSGFEVLQGPPSAVLPGVPAPTPSMTVPYARTSPKEGQSSEDLSPSSSLPHKHAGPGIVHLTRGEAPRAMPKTVDSYVPAGTYVPGILTSGVVASTSTTAQGDPMPIMVRLVGQGTLPRGFKSDLKEAVLIGSCYGDLSSERANCRLHKLSLTERNGEIFEKKVEGWLMGEDGRPGIKGDVVDRAGKVAREALAAGILSGMAGFFKQQATSGSLPSSVLSPQQALTTQDVLKGGAASGAGSALEKLADFSIRRAEQMQPVILVASGRRVDVVFKEGLDFSSTITRQEMQLMSQEGRLQQAQETARSAFVQGVGVGSGDSGTVSTGSQGSQNF